MAETFLALDEVLSGAARLGLELSERTFRYYAVLGLLPKPIKRPEGTSDGRVHHYPPEILDRLNEIRSLQNRGYSLKQIKKFFEVTPAPAATPLPQDRPPGKLEEAARRNPAELPLVTELRQSAARTLAGMPGEPGRQRRLLAHLQTLECLQERAQAIQTGSSAVPTRARDWLAEALGDLARVTRSLLEAIERGEARAVASGLVELDKVQLRIWELERMLDSYQALWEGSLS